MNNDNQWKLCRMLLNKSPAFAYQNWMHQEDTSKPVLMPDNLISSEFNTIDSIQWYLTENGVDGNPCLLQEIQHGFDHGEWESTEDFYHSLTQTIDRLDEIRKGYAWITDEDDDDE